MSSADHQVRDAVEGGLAAAEVARRRPDGRSNDVPSQDGRGICDIVRGNTFPRFDPAGGEEVPGQRAGGD